MLYLKLVNASSVPQALTILLDGASTVEKKGKESLLSATNTQETNTIDDPERVVPVEHELRDLSSSFVHTLPAYSIQVLQIHAR